MDIFYSYCDPPTGVCWLTVRCSRLEPVLVRGFSWTSL